MGSSTTRFDAQAAGSRVYYEVNEFCTNTQVTIGSDGGTRTTGSVIIKYRPFLAEKAEVEITDFETPADNSLSFGEVNGVLNHTFVLNNVRVGHIMVDDSGNGSEGDFWVHITSF